MRVILVRHGETDYNLVRRLQGQLDTQLTDTGRQQALRVAQRLKSQEQPQLVYTSDLVRARHTAECIAEHSAASLHIDGRLREMSLGIFQDHTAREARQRFPDDWRKHQTDEQFVIPQGESSAQFAERCNTALMEIAQRHHVVQDNNVLPTTVICIVTHGGVIDAIGRRWIGDDQEDVRIQHCENTGVCELIFDGEEFVIVSWNDTSHLQQDDEEDDIDATSGAASVGGGADDVLRRA